MARPRAWMAAALAGCLAIAGGAALLDYRAYAGRTNASAVWGWLVTRHFEWTNRSTDVVWNEAALERLSRAGSQEAYLLEGRVPPRAGPRPAMVRGVPHRQIDQHPPAERRSATEQRLAALRDRAEPGTALHFGPSLWELTGAQALIVQGCDARCRPELLRTRGEFSHLHSHDGSAHMMLAPADIALVVRQGWGEVFPIANGLGGRIPWIALVYAPRTAEEEAVFMHILEASYRYASLPARTRSGP